MREIVRTVFHEEFRVESRTRHTLEKLQRGRELLSVLVPADEHEHTSMLLHVDADDQYLIIDEINPPRRPEPSPGDELLCLGRAAGVFAGLRCRVAAHEQWEGYGALRLHWPHAVYHLQRRTHYRVPVRAGDLGEVELHRRGARSVTGECLDLSATGMRLRANAPSDFELGASEWIEQLQFLLDGEAFACPAQLRFVRTLRAPPGEPAPRLVGLRFDQLTPSQQQRLQRYVQRRDRELLRDTRL